jgi:hypothetical protein
MESDMNTQFESIVERLVKEQGQAALLSAAKCKSLLSDYAKNEYRKERHLLLLAIEAGVGKEIAAAADLPICMKIQMRFLKEERFIDERAAAEVIGLLALVLRGYRGTRASSPRSAAPAASSPSAGKIIGGEDAETQYKRGMAYANGQGVTQNDTEAVKWYRKAAEQGHANAQYFLGWMYENGRGVAQNDFEAVKWYRKAAEQGHADAQNALRRMGY